jgi:hypothetical protein
MADIVAIFGTLLVIGIAYPGLLTSIWLLFPSTVKRAQLRLEYTPGRCFWLGGLILAAMIIPVLILLSLPSGGAKFFGWILIGLVIALSLLGSAGLAARMGEQLAARSNNPGQFSAFVRGALVLELGAFFPVLGWLFFLPLTTVTAIGATGFALLNWMPKIVLTSASRSSSAEA